MNYYLLEAKEEQPHGKLESLMVATESKERFLELFASLDSAPIAEFEYSESLGVDEKEEKIMHKAFAPNRKDPLSPKQLFDMVEEWSYDLYCNCKIFPDIYDTDGNNRVLIGCALHSTDPYYFHQVICVKFDDEPVAFFSAAGKNISDHKRVFVIDKELYTKAYLYLKTLESAEEFFDLEIVDFNEPKREFTTFAGKNILGNKEG